MITEHPTIRIKLANTERMEGENPNFYTKTKMEALRASFKTYGKIVDQIIVDDGQLEPVLAEHLGGRYLIINGEHSAQVLQENEVQETDVKLVRCKSDVERRIIRQVANKLHGEHNPMLDAGEYLAILKANQEKRLLQTTAIRETDFYKTIALAGKDEPEDIVPLPPATPITQPGDVWQLGAHRLICGDSTLPGTYEKLMGGGEKAHIVVTDPPYGVDYVQQIQGREGTTGKWKDIKGDELKGKALQEFCRKFLEQIKACTTDDSAYYIFFGMKTFHHLLAAFDEAQIYYALPLIWQKARPTISWAKYHPDYEVLAYGGAGAKGTKYKKTEVVNSGKGTNMGSRNPGNYLPNYEPIAFSGNGAKPNQPRWFAKYDQTTTWQERPDSSMTYAHPTQKPVALAERALLNSSREGEIVLDNFAGSGFSLIAAHKLKRIWRGVELEPGYCDVIVQRFEHYSGIRAERSLAKEAKK